MEELKQYPISVSEVLRSRAVVSALTKPTQLIRYEELSRLIGADVHVKHENHNPTGTFKIRGGINLMSHLRRKGVKGVITFSTGNHGLSIATSARWFGLDAVVVVPENSNPTKVRAIRECGAELVEAGSTFEEASHAVDALCQERGLYYAHPADEPLLINGVGTGFLEILEDLPDVDVMFVPLGAGSEAAAAVTVFRALSPGVRIIAVQAEGSPAAYQSWREGRICHAPNTTFFVLVTEDEIYSGIGAAFYYTHNLAEGAGAATIAAAYKLKDELAGKMVALQMSGANASPEEIVDATKRSTFLEGYPH
jgi:threonine dehydratase